MRIAVSGSHGTGKSTLIAAFVGRCPGYVHEPEAFETLGDDVDLSESGGPDSEGLRRLLEFTAGGLAAHPPPGARVIHEPRFRRRVDEYLRRALFDDEHDLFGGGSPRVLELPPALDGQLVELLRLVTARAS